MIAKTIISKVTLALAVAAVSLPISGPAMAGGYGYGAQSGWSGYQSHAPKRHKARKQVYAGSNRHLAWCFNRYRSYRLMDNTFQPYHGPRQECLSPYEQERRALFVGYPDQAPEILFRDQAGAGPKLTGSDPFGNLPEEGRTGLTSADPAPAQVDPFGNLAEQAAVEKNDATGDDVPAAAVGNARQEGPQLVVTPRAPESEPVAETLEQLAVPATDDARGVQGDGANVRSQPAVTAPEAATETDVTTSAAEVQPGSQPTEATEAN